MQRKTKAVSNPQEMLNRSETNESVYLQGIRLSKLNADENSIEGGLKTVEFTDIVVTQPIKGARLKVGKGFDEDLAKRRRS